MSWVDDTRASYDTVAENYQPLVWASFDDIVVERSMLAAFAMSIIRGGGGQVADIGCGPGDITAHLRDLGLDVTGIDLSPGMLSVARRNHPAIEFREGDMTALDLADADLAGAVSWWSTVHLPPGVLPTVFAELFRVLRPGGLLLVGFHAGDSVSHKTEGYGGLPVNLDVYRRRPSTILDAATDEGFRLAATLTVPARSVRATDQPGAEQCCLLLAKPGQP